MEKLQTNKLFVTSFISFILVIAVSIGFTVSSNEENDTQNHISSLPAVDVFQDISSEWINQWDDFLSPDLSKNDDSFGNESESGIYEDSSLESEDVLSNDISEDLSEDMYASSEDTFASLESSEDSSEPLESSNDVSEPLESSEDISDIVESSEESFDNTESSEDMSEDVSSEFPEDVTLLDNNGKQFVYFQQDSPKYDKIPYGNQTIGSHGCGPTNMAMVISTYTGKVIYPDEAAKWSVKNNCWVNNVGTSHVLMTKMAEAYGVPVAQIPLSSWNEAMTALKNGKMLITRVGDGNFSGGPHFLTIRGITDDGKLLLANSISYDDSVKAWSQDTVRKNITLNHFWVYG